MPFYEYQCGSCEHRLEVLQKMSDDPLLYCPECNEAALKKLVSAAAFRLKGTGWYETDFKDGDKKKQKTADSSSDKKVSDAKPANGDSASKSSESKPSESKPESKPAAKNCDFQYGDIKQLYYLYTST